MKQLILLFFWLIALHLIGFTQIHPGSGLSLDKIMLDPSSGVGGTASQIYDEVDYIPLETTKESLFGEISQLQITDKYFIILDKETDAILFFNRDGSFHHKINKFPFDEKYLSRIESAQGVRAGSILESFSVDPIKQQLFIHPHPVWVQNLYIFSFEGKRIGKLNLPAHTQDYIFLKDGTQYYKQFRPFSLSKLDGYHPYDVLLSRDSGRINKYLFPVNFKYAALLDDMSMHFSYLNYSGNQYQCFYTPDLDNNVYELDSTGIKHQYQFIFPIQYSLPKDFGYDSIYTHKRRSFLKDKSLITNFMGFFKIDDYLILDCVNGNRFNFLYSLKTKRLLLLDHILADDKSYYLPIFGYSNSFSQILACDGKSIFISIPSFIMFQDKELTADKHPKYNAGLGNYFNTQNRKGNPVIVQLKLKENL
jgi:hypothetical protein